MEAENAIAFVRQAFSQRGIVLSEMEEIVIEAAWYNQTYERISEDYSVKYYSLQNYIAPSLWKKLSAILDRKVGKKSFRKIVTPLLQAQEPTDGKDLSSGELEGRFLGAPLPDIEEFVGRDSELDYVSKLLGKFSFTLLTGVEGIGKRSLLSSLVQSKDNAPWKRVIWKTLYHIESAEQLESELLSTISQDGETLVEQLKAEPFLIILDSLDYLLTQRDGDRHLDPAYIRLFQSATAETQSRIVAISPRPIGQINDLILRGKAISYTLRGLNVAEAESILGKRWHAQAKEICEAVGGNPLLLKKLAGLADDVSPELIRRLTVQYGLVGTFYEQMLVSAGLTSSDQKILKELAESSTGITFSNLLLHHPSAAARIKRLLGMGLVSQQAAKSGERVICVEPLFSRAVLGY